MAGPVNDQKEFIRINRIAAMYNMIPNLIWTILFLLPITIFCYREMSLRAVFIVLGISLIPSFFPNSFFDAIQLSNHAEFYKRLGVKCINRFAQNGTLLNQYLRKKYPQLKAISSGKSSIRKTYQQTYFFEKFHFSLFLYFTAITIYALVKGHLLWALALSVCNLLYNIYPNLLQQYIRLKLAPAVKTRSQAGIAPKI